MTETDTNAAQSRQLRRKVAASQRLLIGFVVVAIGFSALATFFSPRPTASPATSFLIAFGLAILGMHFGAAIVFPRICRKLARIGPVHPEIITVMFWLSVLPTALILGMLGVSFAIQASMTGQPLLYVGSVMAIIGIGVRLPTVERVMVWTEFTQPKHAQG